MKNERLEQFFFGSQDDRNARTLYLIKRIIWLGALASGVYYAIMGIVGLFQSNLIQLFTGLIVAVIAIFIAVVFFRFE